MAQLPLLVLYVFDLSLADELADDISSNSSHLSPGYLSAGEPARSSLRRSSSSEVMRQLARRATMKRSTKRSVVHRSSCASQLDAIQRGQKLLDARLQDLQAASSSGSRDEGSVRENVVHVRHLLTETQKALGILVKSMASTQDAIQGMSSVVTAIYNKIFSTGQKGRPRWTKKWGPSPPPIASIHLCQPLKRRGLEF